MEQGAHCAPLFLVDPRCPLPRSFIIFDPPLFIVELFRQIDEIPSLIKEELNE